MLLYFVVCGLGVGDVGASMQWHPIVQFMQRKLDFWVGVRRDFPIDLCVMAILGV